MYTDKKYRRLVWAVVILAAMNVSMLTTIGYHVYQSNKATVQPTSADSTLMNGAVKFSGRYFRDKLSLTPDQMDQFRDINRSFRQQARDISFEMSDIRQQMLTDMAANKSDTIQLNQLSDKMGELHSNLKRITYQFYINIKQICTDDQKLKLEQLFKEFFISDIPVHPQGEGMRRRWRNGNN